MRQLARREFPPSQAAPDVVEPALEGVTEREAEILRYACGILACSARGCAAHTGIACAYVDRRQRRCPTAWCPQHRVVWHTTVYCPVHAGTMGTTESQFDGMYRPDVENFVPMLVNWVAREMEQPVSDMMGAVCAEYRQSVVSDPVRFVLVGVERVRTWERAWKMCSHVGVSLRVHIAVEEQHPNVVVGKVNSVVVVSVPPPDGELQELSEDPAIHDLPEVRAFREQLLAGMRVAVDAWRAREPKPEMPDVALSDQAEEPPALDDGGAVNRLERILESY
jgi:hypothetical protein